jgi:hypothetical protein
MKNIICAWILAISLCAGGLGYTEVYRVCKSTGSAAIALTCAPADQYQVVTVLVHFSAAPTTAADLNITVNSGNGPEYDTLIYTIDPSTSSITSLVWSPCSMILLKGDAVEVSYSNPDDRTYGVTVYYEL